MLREHETTLEDHPVIAATGTPVEQQPHLLRAYAALEAANQARWSLKQALKDLLEEHKRVIDPDDPACKGNGYYAYHEIACAEQAIAETEGRKPHPRSLWSGRLLED